MKSNRRLKFLLVFLVIAIYAMIGVIIFLKPTVDASRLVSRRWRPTPTPSPIITRTATPTPTPTSSSTTLFSDNLSADLSKWLTVYTGYGTVAIENGQLSMAPQASTSPSETHAPLVAAGDLAWKDYIYSVQMNTIQQLRTGSTPNPWEVGWILFRYQDAKHFYYFIPKTNGIELGKFVNDTQTFLATADSPKLTLNTLGTYKITLKGGNIKISVNGTQVIDYTDSSGPLLTGKIGLYNEDAHVHYDNVTVTSN